MPRSLESKPVKIAVMTAASYATCTVWQALIRHYPHELLALTPSNGSLSRSFPHLETIWYKATAEEANEELQIFLRSLLEANPRIDVVLCLPTSACNENALTAFYHLGICEIVFLEEFSGNKLCIHRTLQALQQRRRLESKHQTAHSELKQVLQTKTEYLAWLSHEIRTPMNGLLGMMEILQSTELSRDQSELLEVMGRCSQNVLGLVSDVLDLSRLEASKMRLHQAPFQLRRLIEDSLFLYACDANQRNLMIYNVVAPEVPEQVIGDERKLAQILNNLISNAVKYTEKGQVRVSLDLECQDQHNCLLRFEVRDTGFGISEAELPLVFAAFEQTDSHRLHKGPSSGLGMNLSKQLVELMGGSIQLSSELAKGTSIVLTLPFAQLELETPKTQAKPIERLAVIISDQVERAEILSQILRAEGLRLERRKPTETLPKAHFYFFAEIDAWHQAQEAWVSQQKTSRAFILCNSLLENWVGAAALPSNCEVFELPLRQSELVRRVSSEHRKISPRESSQAFAVQGKHILVVDDDPLNLRVAKRQLSRLATEVTVASSGLAALDLLEKQSFDLIFVDCQMPHMNGSEFLQVIRRMPELLPSTPVIALTAMARAEDRIKILAEGFDDYLAKPAQIEDIADVLKKWLPFETTANRR